MTHPVARSDEHIEIIETEIISRLVFVDSTKPDMYIKGLPTLNRTELMKVDGRYYSYYDHEVQIEDGGRTTFVVYQMIERR